MMLPALPTAYDYQQVLQTPKVYLADPRLKNCQVELDPLGMPKPRSGGFAITYRLENNGHRWALRCFSRDSRDREARYIEICKYISSHPSEILVPIEYLPKGILVKGTWHPVTLMDWVEGDTLGNYIYQNIKAHPKIAGLPDQFLKLVSELDRLGIAHGDLSQQNILLQNGKMILIDYDGIYLPQFKGQKGSEIGNFHFQHPRRIEKDFGPHIDRFSEIVLYLTLCALATSPDLYDKYGKGGEGLLFRRDDFIRPQESRLLKEIDRIDKLKSLAAQFQQVCQTSLENIPKLDDFISHQPIVIPRDIKPARPKYVSSYPIYRSSDHSLLLENEGAYVTVIGKIEDFKKGDTKHGDPYVFFNFGNWKDHCFTVVLWSEALHLLNASGKKPSDYASKWVSVTGLLASYDGGWGPRPQIVLDSPAEMEIISAEEAKARLNWTESAEDEDDEPEPVKETTAAGVGKEVLPVKGDDHKPTGESGKPVGFDPTKGLTASPDISVGLDKLYGNKPISSTPPIPAPPPISPVVCNSGIKSVPSTPVFPSQPAAQVSSNPSTSPIVPPPAVHQRVQPAPSPVIGPANLSTQTLSTSQVSASSNSSGSSPSSQPASSQPAVTTTGSSVNQVANSQPITTNTPATHGTAKATKKKSSHSKSRTVWIIVIIFLALIALLLTALAFFLLFWGWYEIYIVATFQLAQGMLRTGF